MNMALRNKFAQQYANTYVETAVSEASPHKLVEMLYEGALKHLNLTKVFIDQKDFEKKSEHVNKALSILNALRSGVDLDKGKEVAENLYSLYDYCYRRVFEASSQNDKVMIDEVIEHIQALAESWKQMPEDMKRVSKEQIDRMSA
ncbi:MAG: flagellar export chaperone FliS [Pseudomonadota bacterium]|nr:flagellar export chaperone FliS [Pseudomonadota bacterium]